MPDRDEWDNGQQVTFSLHVPGGGIAPWVEAHAGGLTVRGDTLEGALYNLAQAVADLRRAASEDHV